MTKTTATRRRKAADPSKTMPKTTAAPVRSLVPDIRGDAGGTDLASALALIAKTRQALLSAQVALEAIVRDSIDPAEQAAASAGLLRIQRDLEFLDNLRRVLSGDSATLNPPSDTDISNPLRPTVSTSTPPGTLATALATYWQVMISPIWLNERPSSLPMIGSKR